MTAPRRSRPSADDRILDAARRLVQRGGVALVTMGDVAIEAGVSKALVLYHFHDKDTLLAALVDSVGEAVLARGRAAGVVSAERPLDAHWDWLKRELAEGDLRVLLSLADCDSAAARAASRRVADERRRLVAADVEAIVSRLGLTTRMPAALIAETVQAFVDGLVCRHALGAMPDPRGAFDVLWLSLLTLSE